MVFDPIILDKLSRVYDLDVDVKVKQKKSLVETSSSNNENGTHGMELNGMLRIKLPEPDIFSPFGLSVISHNNETNTLFVSDHGSSRIIAIPTYNENILNEHIQNYTPLDFTF